MQAVDASGVVVAGKQPEFETFAGCKSDSGCRSRLYGGQKPESLRMVLLQRWMEGRGDTRVRVWLPLVTAAVVQKANSSSRLRSPPRLYRRVDITRSCSRQALAPH